MILRLKQKPTKNSSKAIFYKSVAAENITVDEESRIVKAYVAVWNNIDDSQDILRKGCCAKSIIERGPGAKTKRKIKFLYQHDIRIPLGNPIEIKEDDHGLYTETPIDVIPKGDEVITQLKSETLSQFSIGYMYVWDKCEWVEVDDPDEPGTKCYVLDCKEIELFEYSVVTFGCNEDTSFEGMKSTQLLSQQNQLRRDTERLVKSLPEELEYEIRQLITKHIALNEAKPGKPLPVITEPQKKEAIDFKTLFTALNN
jgi:HK97 family phage prohead protease